MIVHVYHCAYAELWRHFLFPISFLVSHRRIHAALATTAVKYLAVVRVLWSFSATLSFIRSIGYMITHSVHVVQYRPDATYKAV